MEQTEAFRTPPVADRLTLSEGFDFLFRHHLDGLPCARPFNSNRKALCKTIGHIWFDELTELDISNKHIRFRRSQGKSPQTIRHEIKLVVMLYNNLRRWKKKKFVLDGFDFAGLRLPEECPANDIERPRAFPRKQTISQNDFSKWCEHCIPRLLERTYFAMDFGLTPVDMRILETSKYNPTTDCLRVRRNKTHNEEELPVTNRCRSIILKAIAEKRRFILDMTNHDKDVVATRKASGVYFWFGRDIRTTYYNEILRATNRNYRAAQRAMVHSDSRTGPQHYEVSDGEDLRPAIRKLERRFA